MVTAHPIEHAAGQELKSQTTFLVFRRKRNMDGEDRHTGLKKAGVFQCDGHLTGAIYVLKSGFCVAWIPCPSRLRSKGIQADHKAMLAKIGFLRKEVIQPQVPLRLPCYDFTPVADPTVVACLPCGLAQRLRVKPTPMV